MNDKLPFIVLIVLLLVGVVNFFVDESLWIELGLIGFLVVFYYFFVRRELLSEFNKLSDTFERIENRFEKAEKMLDLEIKRLEEDIKKLKTRYKGR